MGGERNERFALCSRLNPFFPQITRSTLRWVLYASSLIYHGASNSITDVITSITSNEVINWTHLRWHVPDPFLRSRSLPIGICGPLKYSERPANTEAARFEFKNQFWQCICTPLVSTPYIKFLLITINGGTNRQISGCGIKDQNAKNQMPLLWWNLDKFVLESVIWLFNMLQHYLFFLHYSVGLRTLWFKRPHSTLILKCFQQFIQVVHDF